MNARHGIAPERQRAGEPGHREPVPDVLRGFVSRQRIEVKARDHALRKLFEFGPRQHRAQFGLADEHDLQQLALVRLQVGQQAQLLQHLDREHLCLVDDEHVVLPHCMGAQQKLVERVEVVLDGCRLRAGVLERDAELLAHRAQQLHHRELRVEDVRHVAALRDLLQEAAAHRRLAGTDFAAEQHEPAAAAQAVEQVRQRLAMALAHEQKARVWRDREGLVLQAEVLRVHGGGGYPPRMRRLRDTDCAASDGGGQNAEIPVIARPRISACTSCVPS